MIPFRRNRPLGLHRCSRLVESRRTSERFLGGTMKHIPKQQLMGCAVASAAMLADVSYEEVAAHWPDLDEARMRWPREFCALVEAVTDSEWHFSPCWHPQLPVRKFPFPKWPVAAFIQDADLRPRFGQWIVVRHEIV